MYECASHAKGHRTEEARDECLKKAKRKAKREAAKKADVLRREDNCARESVDAYVKRRFCIEGTQAVNVAASLNRDYPHREGHGPYDWADVIEVHSLHLNWPRSGEIDTFLAENPKVLLPSEIRKLAGDSVESAIDP